MTTITTSELAKEVGLTSKSIRQAIHRGDLLATRVSKGAKRTAQAMEFVVSREAADDWKARRAAHQSGLPFSAVIEAQTARRNVNSHANFQSKDESIGSNFHAESVERWKHEALEGSTKAREQLRQPWECGGIGLTRWFRAGVGEIV